MNDQIDFCETIIADLGRLFPDFPADWSTTNARTAKLGRLVTITMPAQVARRLIDAYGKPPS